MMKRISWQYTHYLNSRSSVEKTKHGEYIGKVKHTCKQWNKSRIQMAIVKFDGNKRTSSVPFDELKFEQDIK